MRLAILGESPCMGCTAACCKQNGHDYAVLLEGSETRKFAAFSVEVPIVRGQHPTLIERVLPYRDGRCIFLGEDDRCLIYDDRPVNCRRFQCVGGYNSAGGRPGKHSDFLLRNAPCCSCCNGCNRPGERQFLRGRVRVFREITSVCLLPGLTTRGHFLEYNQRSRGRAAW